MEAWDISAFRAGARRRVFFRKHLFDGMGSVACGPKLPRGGRSRPPINFIKHSPNANDYAIERADRCALSGVFFGRCLVVAYARTRYGRCVRADAFVTFSRADVYADVARKARRWLWIPKPIGDSVCLARNAARLEYCDSAPVVVKRKIRAEGGKKIAHVCLPSSAGRYGLRNASVIIRVLTYSCSD